jgi:hypothetical protein
MVKRVQYVNKITRETSPTLEQWMSSIVDSTDKENAIRIYDTEVSRSEGVPSNEYIAMFERYFQESNIDIVTT